MNKTCLYSKLKFKPKIYHQAYLLFNSDSDKPFEVGVRKNIKFYPNSVDVHCLEYLRFEYGPLEKLCSNSDGGYYDFNGEKKYSRVNTLRLEYKTERDTLGGYFLLEIRGNLYYYDFTGIDYLFLMCISSNSVKE